MSNNIKNSNLEQSDEYVNALIDQAVTSSVDEMPAALKQTVVQEGEAFLRTRSLDTENTKAQTQQRKWWLQPVLAWSVAALSLGLSVFMLTQSTSSVPQLDQLVDTLSVNPELSWKDLGESGYANVRGFVKWDNERQLGYMVIDGVPENNPSLSQYQLWIVDPDRDQHPVDAGVFDLVAGTNRILIDPKLQIIEPKAFAVTLEKPGGVVVSEGPLLFVASI